MHVLVDKKLPRKAESEGPKAECTCKCQESRAEKEPDDAGAFAAVRLDLYYKING
jgi:hypothetical protein